jgi:hypothetical protein
MAQQFAGRVDFAQTLPSGDVLAPLGGGSGLTVTVWIDGDAADMRVGGNGGQSGDIRVYSAADLTTPTVHIDGAAGDVKLSGGDCAEELEVAPGHEETPPGSVMSLDTSGRLRPSARDYDRTVVGVVSGGGATRPGIILARRADTATRLPIALAGTAYCLVDARKSPISPGDLLTTATLPGHAMRADDPANAFGACLGKAMASLAGAVGLIPILVALT